ncbi:MAG: hypothetical protein Q4D27_00765 [Coriobacteriia bacterium]|nr:hypothetical protein [Coriobacteriia bacterium]
MKAASLTVNATDDFTMLGIGATAAVAGTAGVGVTAIVAKSSNTIEAYLGKSTTVTCTGDVSVTAFGDRDVQMYLATVSGGTVGVGVTVLVTVVGGKLDQDSHDALLGSQDPAPVLDEDGNVVGTYRKVASPAADDLETYYEYTNSGKYLKTADTEVDPNKVYYFLDDSDGDEDGEVTFFDPDKLWADLLESLLLEDYVYEEVTTPAADDLATYYEYTGDYLKTTDTEVDPNKVYYYLDHSDGDVAGTYKKVKHPKAEDLSTYYEKNATPYVLTEDTTLVTGKTYYAQVDPNPEATKAIYEKLSGTSLRDDLAGDGESHADEGVNGDDLAGVTYVKVDSPEQESLGTYYELKSGSYVQTQDIVLNTSKTYYVAQNNATMNSTVTSTAGKAVTATDLGDADVPVINGSDTVRAFVGADSKVTSHDITVDAKSHLLLDIMAFTVAGGAVAVSPTVAVGITYANAAAYTEAGSTLIVTGDVKVTSWTGSTKVSAPAGSDEAARNEAFQNQVEAGIDNDNYGNVGNAFNGRSVRVVAVSAGGGAVAVAPVIAYLGLDSNSYAFIAGNVDKAASVLVKAETHFPVAAAATFGLAGGAVAVTASAAVVVSNGMVYAGIVGPAVVKNVTGTVAVKSDTTFDATTFAASLAGGAIAVNGATSIAGDHMMVHTFVGKATTLSNVGTLDVGAKANVSSHANIIGGSAGAIAVKIGVAVATMEPTILTYVGTTPIVTGKVTEAIVGAGGTNNTATVGTLIIANDITTAGQALTLGVSAGAISVSTNVLVVSNDTLARAGIFGKNVTVTGGTTIDAGFAATSDTQLLAINAGAIAVGVNVFVANLTADNRAVVDTTGATVATGSLSVYAGRSNDVNITSAEATGIGSTMAAIAVTVNVAYAENATVNNAEVIGTGTLAVTGGALTVEANGRATAQAQMGSGVVSVSGAEIVSNNSFAYLDATQEARLADATITTNGGAVRIASNFNLPTGSGSNVTNYGAVSKIGVNGGGKDKEGEKVRVTLLGIKVAVGKARMDATVRAIAEGVTLDTAPTAGGTRGTVDVLVNAHSYAYSDTLAPTVDIALVDVGVADSRAWALGTFEAILGLAGTSNTGATNVATSYDTYSYAANGPLGGLSVSVVSSITNVARSTTGTAAKAGLAGTGTLDVSGSLTVTATGSSHAVVEGRTPKVSISGFKVAVNDVAATQSVVQEAYSTFAGTLTTSGLMAVTSTLGTSDDPIAATATVGSSSGASIALLGITVNTAVSKSASTNKAYITGAGSTATSYEVGPLNVAAKTYAISDAAAKTGFSVGLATGGDLDARASSCDYVSASVSKLALTSTGNVSIIGTSQATVNGTAITAGSVSGTTVSVLRAYTDMGSASSPQTVVASVGDDTSITSPYDIAITAKNLGSTEGKINGGGNVSVDGTIDVTFYSKSNFKTEAGIGAGSTLDAGGSILVTSESKPEAASDAKASSISLSVDVSKTYSTAEATTDTTASIGAGAKLTAGVGVSVIARGNVKQDTVSAADSVGVFSGKGSIQAYNTVNRTVSVTVGEGATITADFSDIDLKAVAGDNDSITNRCYVEAGGFAGFSKVRSYSTIDSAASTTIGAGAVLEDTFGAINIISDSSLEYFYNYVSADARGVGAEPDSATTTSIKLASTVTVGEDSTSTAEKATAYITGCNVTIESLNSTMKAIDSAYAYGAALGANVDAWSDAIAHVDNLTTVRNTIIRGYDTVTVASTSSPKVTGSGNTSSGNNIYSRAYGAIYAVGDVTAKAYLAKDSTFTTKVDMDTTTIYGADIDITSTNDLRYETYASGYKSSFLAAIYRYTINPVSDNVSATVGPGENTLGSNNLFYVGDAAAGIVIDVSGTVYTPVVRTVGLRGERDSGREIYRILRGEGGYVQFGKISNPLKGTLYVTCNLNGSVSKVDVPVSAVYDQNMIPYVRIINSTDLDVIIGAISVENASYLNPSVNGVTATGVNKTGVTGGIDGAPVRPEVSVISNAGGDVTVGGLVYNPTGSVGFTWTDPDNRGSLYVTDPTVATTNLSIRVAPIWAHTFTVSGAQDVGTAAKRVNLYATWLDTALPTTSVHAAGSIYFGITDVKLASADAISYTAVAAGTAFDANKTYYTYNSTSKSYVKAEGITAFESGMTYYTVTATPRDSAVIVSDIAGNATTDLYVNTAMTIYRDPDSIIITMPTPGTLEYTDTKVGELASEVTLDVEALQAYLIASTEDGMTFLLPNGTYIYTDVDGIVTRVIEGSIDVQLSDYAVSKNSAGQLVATLGDGVSINLATGVITIDEGASLEMLLSSVSGAWIKNLVTGNGTVIVYDYSTPVEQTVTFEDGTTATVSIPTVAELSATELVTFGNVTYYQLVSAGTSFNVASYTLAAAFGGASDPVTLTTGTAFNAWLNRWGGSLTDTLLITLVNELIYSEDYDDVTDAERATAAATILARDDLYAWLFTQLSTSGNRDVLEELDRTYSDLLSSYLSADVTPTADELAALHAWIAKGGATGTFDAAALETLVGALIDSDDYGTAADLATYLPDWSGFGDWLLGKLTSSGYTSVVTELDALAEGTDEDPTLSTLLAGTDYTGADAWAYITSHITEGATTLAADYLAKLVSSADIEGGNAIAANAIANRILATGGASETDLLTLINDRLKLDENAELLTAYDLAYSDVLSNYLSAGETPTADELAALQAWIAKGGASGTLDAEAFEAIVFDLLVDEDYDTETELVAYLPDWSGFGDWLLGKLKDDDYAAVLAELDNLVVVGSDTTDPTLSVLLLTDGYTGAQAWDYITGHIGGNAEKSAADYLVELVSSDDIADGRTIATSAIASRILATDGASETDLLTLINDRLKLDGNAELLTAYDKRYWATASAQVAAGSVDGLTNWFAAANLTDTALKSLVTSLLTTGDLTSVVYTHAGLNTAGTAISNRTTLNSWLYTHLTNGTAAASAAVKQLNAMTVPTFTNCVYLLSYDSSTDTMGAWQVSQAQTSSGTVYDYLDDTYTDEEKGTTDDGDVIFSEIHGGSKFIGYLLVNGGKTGNTNSDGYATYNTPTEAIANVLAHPETISISGFLGSTATVVITPTYKREGVDINRSDYKEYVLTGITSYAVRATVADMAGISIGSNITLTAIKKSGDYCYVDWAAAVVSDEYRNNADARSLYEYLRNIIWTEDWKSTLTKMTVYGKNGNGNNPVTATEFSNKLVTRANLETTPYDCLRMAYLTGTKKKASNRYNYVILHPYEHTVTFNYIKLTPADAILGQETTYTEVASDAAFDANTTYYVYDSVNSRHVEASGITAFASGTTYYTASAGATTLTVNQAGSEGAVATNAVSMTKTVEYTEVASDAAFDASATYYTFDSTNRCYVEATGITAFASGITYYTASTINTASRLTLLGPISGAQVKSTSLPEDTVWASSTSSKVGYQITEALYVANDGTYYFREATDYAGFVAWFNKALGSKDFATVTVGEDGVESSWSKTDLANLLEVRKTLLTNTTAFAAASLTKKLFAINIALLEDEYVNVTQRARAALNALNDKASYATWLAQQISNARTTTQIENAQLALAALDLIGGSAGSASNYLSAGAVQQAWYLPIGTTETFNATYTIVNTPVSNGAQQASTVVLKPNQDIYLEVLSPEVARSADGLYYVLGSDGTYQQATEGTHTSGTGTKVLDDGTTWTNATTDTFKITYGGTTYLTIKRYYTGTGTAKKLVFLEYTLRDGTLADSDGNVVPATDAWVAVAESGSTYALSGIVGVDTTVTLADSGAGAALVNGDPTPAITGDTITIITGNGVDIGTDDDPLVTAPCTAGGEVEVEFVTLSGDENVITGDVYLETDGSVKLPDDLTVTEGASYHHTASLDIIYTTIDVAKNAVLELEAARDVKGVYKEDGTESCLTAAAGGTATLTAHRDNVFQNVVVADATDAASGGSVTLATAGAYTNPAGEVEDGSVTGHKAEVGAYGVFTMRNDAGYAKFDEIDAAAGSAVAVDAKAGIVGDVIVGTGDAKFTLTTDGDINTADDYLVVDLPEGTALNIAHAANYYLVGAQTLAEVTGRTEDGNEATGTDFGSLGDETVTTTVVSGDSADLAAWILARIEGHDDVIALLDAAAADPVDAIIAAGDADAFAAWLARQKEQGTLDDAAIAALVAALVTDTDVAPAANITAGDLAAAVLADTEENRTSWITARLDADDPRLAGLDAMSDEELAALVESLITEEEVAAANATAHEAYEAARAAYVEDVLADIDNLAGWLVAHLAGNAEAVAALDAATAEAVDDIIAAGDADALAAWLDSQKAQGQVTGATLAQAVSMLMTATDLAALERDAWAATTYPATDPDALDALVGLTIAVGESTGSAYVKNLGDIAITQATGTMTVGAVVSEFGDVALSTIDAATGDIVGDAAESVNVQASDITITAAGNVDALVIETGVVELTAIATSIENEATGAVPAVVYDSETGSFTTVWDVDYEQIANYDKRATGSLTITAADDVDITEKSGELGVNTIVANGDVELTAVAIVDVRDDATTEPNITASGVTLTATNGNVGSADAPIELDTDGGTVNAVARYDVYLTEVVGDMVVGAIVAGGDVNLVVEDGALVDADTDDLISTLADLLEEARVAQAEADSAAESARLREETLQQLLEAYESAQAAYEAAAQAAADAAQVAADAQAVADDAQAEVDAAQAQADALAAAEQALADAQAAGDAAQAAAETAQAQADALAAAEQALADAEAAGDADAIAEARAALDQVAQDIATALGIDAADVTDELLAQNVTAAQAVADEAAAAAAAVANAAQAAQDAANAAEATRDEARDAYEAFKAEVDAYKQTAEDKAAEAAAATAAAADIQARLDALEEAREEAQAAQDAADAANDALEALKQQIADELGIDPDDVTDELLAQRMADEQAAADQAATDAEAAQQAADLAAAFAALDAERRADRSRCPAGRRQRRGRPASRRPGAGRSRPGC